MMQEAISALRALTDSSTAVLVYTPVSRQYLTGFSSSLGYLFITPGQTVLFVDGRYAEAAESAVPTDIKVVLIEKLAVQVRELLGENVTTLLTETSITVATVQTLERAFGYTIQPSDEMENRLQAHRIIKADAEVEAICRAQRIAEQAFLHILDVIRPGVSEVEIAAELEYHMKRAGSLQPSFETIAVSGEKSSMPHGVPGERIVQKGDFITMDFGATIDGYHSDMTRTIAVGHISEEMKKVYETVLAANLAALEQVAEGATCASVDLAARDLITDAGYGAAFSHSTGHGVGLEIHEAPTISFKNETKLRSGMVITIEPGIYLPGEFGVRIEDMVVVTKNGCNNLTNTEKRLIIL